MGSRLLIATFLSPVVRAFIRQSAHRFLNSSRWEPVRAAYQVVFKGKFQKLQLSLLELELLSMESQSCVQLKRKQAEGATSRLEVTERDYLLEIC